MTMTTLDDWALALTERLIAQIEANPGTWLRPWAVAGASRNALTGATYQGSNFVALALQGYDTPWFATYKQWQALGAQVTKGSTGIQLIKWGTFRPKADRDADPDTPGPERLYASVFHVFHQSQVEGWTAPPLDRGARTVPELQAILDAIPAVVHPGDDRAYYSPTHDRVHLPDISRFANPLDYYATAFHEFAHWTGHTSRLNRPQLNSFGSTEYAQEELVAELSAAMTCAQVGIDVVERPDHAQYLANWIAALRATPRSLVTWASHANAASQLVLSYSQPVAAQEVA
jgi:antirestriction protein ArdC